MSTGLSGRAGVSDDDAVRVYGATTVLPRLVLVGAFTTANTVGKSAGGAELGTEGDEGLISQAGNLFHGGKAVAGIGVVEYSDGSAESFGGGDAGYGGGGGGDDDGGGVGVPARLGGECLKVGGGLCGPGCRGRGSAGGSFRGGGGGVCGGVDPCGDEFDCGVAVEVGDGVGNVPWVGDGASDKLQGGEFSQGVGGFGVGDVVDSGLGRQVGYVANDEDGVGFQAGDFIEYGGSVGGGEGEHGGVADHRNGGGPELAGGIIAGDDEGFRGGEEVLGCVHAGEVPVGQDDGVVGEVGGNVPVEVGVAGGDEVGVDAGACLGVIGGGGAGRGGCGLRHREAAGDQECRNQDGGCGTDVGVGAARQMRRALLHLRVGRFRLRHGWRSCPWLLRSFSAGGGAGR